MTQPVHLNDPAPNPLGHGPLELALAIAAAAGLSWAQRAAAQQAPPAPAARAASDAEATPQPDPATTLSPIPALRPAPRPSSGQDRAPIYLRAESLQGQPGATVSADGGVELRHAGIVIRADQLRYDQAEDLAVAQGRVRISFNGAVFTGPQAQLHVQRIEGFMDQPAYEFAQTQAGGRADRIDFLGPSRSQVANANYTSCTRDGSSEPDWVLSADSLSLDVEDSSGVAEGAELRFLGVPILALPRMSFPLSDQRKSGWLPPSMELTTGSGFELAVPYYWNIAPNRDATIAPGISTRRGFAVDGEFRYLAPSYAGKLNLDFLPYDQVAERTRYWLTLGHEGELGAGTRYSVLAERVSDQQWWNDFPRRHRAITPRLLPLFAQVTQDLDDRPQTMQFYARTQLWQTQQFPNVMDSPFQRIPQLGLSGSGDFGPGLNYALESELNRFTLPTDPGYTALTRPSDGTRLHALGWLSRPWREPGWWVTPSVLFNAAAYSTDQPMPDGRSVASRFIPTFSLGGGAELERPVQWLGRALRQTLEPRLLYVNTPFVDQNNLPNFDSAVKDYSFASIYSENVFSGVDRVSDTNGITFGATTRLLDAASGAELLQLGVVQRYLFSPQVVTENGITEKAGFSDVLLRGSTNVLKPWNLEAYLRYSPNVDRVVRAIVGTQYNPGPFRTLNLTYRYARDIASQVELGWQWPLYQPDGEARRNASGGTGCGGAWYSVGRINYNITERRATDSIVGIEYDAGCWIARVAVSRWSTGVSEASTQVLLQLELVGLSRLGSNAVGVLRDNIPGYTLLRDSRSATPASAFYD